MALLFSNSTFDFENKRLVSDSGRFALQWRIRLHPDQPESYENQQTNCGTVVFVHDFACSTPGPEVEEGALVGYWTGETDTWGKLTIMQLKSERPVYLFPGEFVAMRRVA